MKHFIEPTEKEVIEKLAQQIGECAEKALLEHGVFRVGLSGGSVINYLSEAIQRITSDLTKWKFFFCDERYVEPNDADSTFGSYLNIMIPKTSIEEQQFVCIDTKLPLDECARDYEAKVRKEFQVTGKEIPSFDLLLLGMGPDGHTCSLFPGHALLEESTKLIAPIHDSPKEPPKRVTMTLPLINQAKCCVYAMCGEGKAEMVKRVFKDGEKLPAGLVQPLNGSLIGIFDEKAAKYLK